MHKIPIFNQLVLHKIPYFKMRFLHKIDGLATAPSNDAPLP